MTLPHAQINVMKCFQVVGKEFPVPEALRVSKLPWTSPQCPIDGFPLGLTETSRTALPFSFMQSGKPAFFKALNPAFDRAGVLSQNTGNVITAQAVSNQEDAMQPVIIAGFLGSQDFLLHRNPHDLFIRDLQFTHGRALLSQNMAGGAEESNLIMRHNLCRSA